MLVIITLAAFSVMPFIPLAKAQTTKEILVSEDTYVESDRSEVRGEQRILEVRYAKAGEFVSYSILKFNLVSLPEHINIRFMGLVVVSSRIYTPLWVGTYFSPNTAWNETSLDWKAAEFARQITDDPSDSKLVSSPPTGNRTLQFDLTSFVPQLTGRGEFTILMKPSAITNTTSTGVVQFYSKDQPDPNRVPKISVTYEVAPTSTTLQTSTLTTSYTSASSIAIIQDQQLAGPAVLLAIVLSFVASVLIIRRRARRKPATPEAIGPPPTVQIAPPETSKLVPTGTGGLDRALNGGLPAKSAALLVTEFSDEADQILVDFVRNRCADGQFGLYVTSRDRPGISTLLDTIPSVVVLVCHPSSGSMYAGKPRVVREDLGPNQINIGRVEVEKGFIRDRTSPKFAVIDLISPLLVENDAKTARFWLSEFVQKLKVMNFTTIAVANPKMHRPEELAIISDVFDGEVELVGAVDGSAFVVIVKRFADHDYQRRPVKI